MAGEIDMLVEGLLTNNTRQKIVAFAMSYVRAPYRPHTNPHQPQSTEHGFDCSSFVTSVLSACGINLPPQIKHSWELYNKLGSFIPPEEKRAGDLMFWHTGPYKRDPNHVSIYDGRGNIIHATRSAGMVVVKDLVEYTQELPVQLRGVKRVTIDA